MSRSHTIAHPSRSGARRHRLRRSGSSALSAALALLSCGLLGGCQGPALQANMTDAQYQQVLAADYPPGMTLEQVKAELKSQRVSQYFSHLYPAKPDGSFIYLVRTYPPTGPWPQFGPDSNVEFVDVSFVFGADGRLVRSAIYRDGVRYGNGMLMYGPDRPGIYQQTQWMSGGPPADPLQGAY